jgi:hypothetical protein
VKVLALVGFLTLLIFVRAIFVFIFGCLSFIVKGVFCGVLFGKLQHLLVGFQLLSQKFLEVVVVRNDCLKYQA